MVLSPAGFFAIITLVIVGRLLGRGIDGRYLMATGLCFLALGGYWMARLNLEIGPWHIVWPRAVLIVGLSATFAPLNVAAFLNMPPQLRGAAVGLLALLRNEDGSVGTSLAQTIHERREQFHSLRLNENLDSLNPALTSCFNQVQPGLIQQNGDPVATKLFALQILDNLRAAQSSALAYFGTFFIFSVIPLILIGLVFLMKRSVAAKGVRISAE